MKKRKLSIVLMVFVLLVLSGCKKEEVLHLGLNAEIMEISVENQVICVKDAGESSAFGEKCFINCNEAIEKHQILYCNYETHEIKEIGFEDLQVGDDVILALSGTELAQIAENAVVKTTQIQLGTQRLNEGSR